jgi:hypothetical protein
VLKPFESFLLDLAYPFFRQMVFIPDFLQRQGASAVQTEAELNDLGFQLGDNAFEDAFNRFKELADKKKKVYDEDIIALVDEAAFKGSDWVQLKSLNIHCGSAEQTAEIELTVDGQLKKAKESKIAKSTETEEIDIDDI